MTLPSKKRFDLQLVWYGVYAFIKILHLFLCRAHIVTQHYFPTCLKDGIQTVYTKYVYIILSFMQINIKSIGFLSIYHI